MNHRGGTGLLYVNVDVVRVHGASPKDSALSMAVRVARHIRVCVCAHVYVCKCLFGTQDQAHYLPNLQAGTTAAASMGMGWRDLWVPRLHLAGLHNCKDTPVLESTGFSSL